MVSFMTGVIRQNIYLGGEVYPWQGQFHRLGQDDLFILQ